MMKLVISWPSMDIQILSRLCLNGTHHLPLVMPQLHWELLSRVLFGLRFKMICRRLMPTFIVVPMARLLLMKVAFRFGLTVKEILNCFGDYGDDFRCIVQGHLCLPVLG